MASFQGVMLILKLYFLGVLNKSGDLVGIEGFHHVILGDWNTYIEGFHHVKSCDFRWCGIARGSTM